MSEPIIPPADEDCIQHPSTSVIVFEDVHLTFEDNAVLRGVSFHLPLGETKALFGVAGAGKSTILKLALGLLPPDSGRITVLGSEITQMHEQDLFPIRERLGMVFQESALFDSLLSLPRGQYFDVPMSFLISRDGKVIFDGDIRQLRHTKDEYIR